MALYRSSGENDMMYKITEAGDFLTCSGRIYTRPYSGLAYCRLIKGKRTDTSQYSVGPFLLSQDHDAVIYAFSSYSPWSSQIGSLTFNNQTWYFNGSGYGFDYNDYDTVLNTASVPQTIEYAGLLNFSNDANAIETRKQVAYDTLLYLKNKGLKS